MPLYTYKCECGYEEEEIVSYEERDTIYISCEKCGKKLCRGIDAPKIGSEPYKMKAVMRDGSHVKGHFGKTAKRDKK
jgi:predicted nucleic acid-binding Zn ribbon protein